MHHEKGYQRYFVYLNLFMGMMLLLVLGNNFLVTFVGWEGVGLCSYLLIGFYYDQDEPPRAGRKAFVVNRIGDFAFLVGLFALVQRFGTLDYRKIFAAVEAAPHAVQATYALGLSFAGFVALCLFIGATGKSAQVPLYVWLPRSSGWSRSSAPSPPSSPPPSALRSTTSSACSPTPPSRSWATCSSPPAPAPTRWPSSTSARTPSSRRCSSSAR